MQPIFFRSMGITAEMLRPFLEGWTMKQIVEAKRLFMVDLKILEDLTTKDDWPVSCFEITFDMHMKAA